MRKYILITALMIVSFLAGVHFEMLVQPGGALGPGMPAAGGVQMSPATCESIEMQIRSSVGGNEDRLTALGVLWRENCRGRKTERPAPRFAKPLPRKTCAAIETLIKEQINNIDGRSLIPRDHFNRARLYANMALKGCLENRDKHAALALRSIEIGRALDAPFVDLRGFGETLVRLGMMDDALALIDVALRTGFLLPEEIEDVKAELSRHQ